MSADVDIRQLAIVREDAAAPAMKRRRHVLSRYVVPAILVCGFVSLVAWAARDRMFPPREVWVVPVIASQSLSQHEGTPVFQAAGWIEPRPTPIRVAALAAGVVDRLLVVEDQAVKAGEPVATLINEDAKLARDRAAADLKLKEAELNEVRAELQAAQIKFDKPVHLQAALGEAEAALAAVTTELKNLPFEARRAQAQLEFAEKNFEGKHSAKGAVSERAVDLAKSELDAARATVEELSTRAETLTSQQVALIQRRDALETQLELLADETQAKQQAEARVQGSTARVEQAKVALAEAQLRLERMTVRAPVDGRVYQLVAFPGTTLTGGMSPVANADGSTVVTLYQPSMLQVRADVRFEDIPKVQLGQQVQIKNPALPAPINGKVLFVSSEANIQKNTLQVKVELDSPPVVFKPEMLVDATFLAPKPAESATAASEELQLYVPQSSILHGDGGSFVWVADQSSGRARKASVTAGRVAPGGIQEVTRGLTAGGHIIVRGQENLRDGQRIKVAGEETPSAAVAASAGNNPQTLNRLPAGAQTNGTH
jgi:RND family efflux transporter MFP subunit